jgi:hypothetical protein
MNTVLDLMSWLQLEEEQDEKNSDLDLFFGAFADRFGSDHIAVQQYREFRDKASGKTAKSIVISASARLSPFRISEVKRIFSRDSMCLDMVGEEKTAVFVVVPPTNVTFNFIAGMLFTQLFQELNHCALNKHKHDGQRLPVPCRFILDEFANTCKIPNFVQILAYARSLGVGITTILQSLEQIKNLYKDEWGVIVDNSNTLLYLGAVTHMDTLEYISKLLGKGTFDKSNYSRTRGRQGSSSTSTDKIGRELLDPAEIRKMKKSMCLFFVGGKNPYYSQKIDMRRHKNYKYTADANKENIYTYKPEIPKESTLVSADEGVEKTLSAAKITFDAVKTKEEILKIVNVFKDGDTEFSNVFFEEDDLGMLTGMANVLDSLAEKRAGGAELIDEIIRFTQNPTEIIETLVDMEAAEADGIKTEFANTEVTEIEKPEEVLELLEIENYEIEDDTAMSTFTDSLLNLDTTKLFDINR